MSKKKGLRFWHVHKKRNKWLNVFAWFYRIFIMHVWSYKVGKKGHHKHFTLNTCYAKLCQSRMEPIMYYVAGVCGTDIRRIVQLIQNRVLRYFLGSKKIASNTATRGYLGWCLAYTKQILEVFRLLFFIQHSSNNMLIKNNRICSSLILRSCDYKVKHVI